MTSVTKAQYNRNRKRLKQALSGKFKGKPTTQSALIVGPGHVKIGGNYYDAQVDGNAGGYASVSNIGRPAAAIYSTSESGVIVATGTASASTTTSGGSGGGSGMVAHDIVGPYHTATGLALDVVGLSATNTLAMLRPSEAPGAAAALLKSSSAGGLALESLTTPLINTSSGNLTLTPAGYVSITGTDSSATAGPHVRLTTGADAYPQLHLFPYSHDNVAINFDLYHDGAWRASDTTGFQLYKLSDKAQFRYFSGGTPGSTPTFSTAWAVDLANGYVGIGTGSPGYQLDVSGITRSTTSVLTPLLGTTSGNLTIEPASDIVEFPASVQIKSEAFASQTTGWRITYDGQADFRYLYADEMHVKAFIADLEQALAGGQIITKSVSTLSRDFTVPYPGSSVYLYVNDLPSASNMAVFESGDVIRLRQFSRSAGSLSVTDTWGTVASYTDGTDEQRWTFTRSGSVTYNTIAQVASPQTQTHAGATSLTITKVSGTSSGHAMIGTITTASDVTITPPSGWTLIASTSTTGVVVSVYYKVAGGSEPANYTWSYSSSVASAGSIAAYSNVYSAVYSGYTANTNTSSTSMIGATAEMISAKNMLLFCGGVSADVASTPPSGMTERADVGVASIRTYLAEQLLSASGLTGTRTATISSSTNSAVIMVGLLPTYTVTGSRGGAATPASTIEAESIVLDYGVSGNGFYEVNAIDGLYGANSPYTQIVTWATHPYDGKAVRMRMGNLAGLSISDYGLRMGTDVSATALTTFDFRASTGVLYLGNQSAGHLYFDGTDLHLRSNTTNKITLDSSGNAYFSGALTIGTNGGIYQGTGTFSSPTTGMKIWNTSGIGRIAGYNSGTPQWYASTDGRMYAGGGSVTLDSSGITLLTDSTSAHASQSDTSAVTFERSGGTLVGRLTSFYASSAYGIDLYARAPNTENVLALFGAEQAGTIYGGGAAGAPRIVAEIDNGGGGDELRLYANSGIYMYRSGSASADFSLTGSTAAFNVDIDMNGADIYDVSNLAIGASSTSELFEAVGSTGNVSINTNGIVLQFSRASANYIQATNSGGYLLFVTNGLSTSIANSSMYLDTSKNVGIGGGLSAGGGSGVLFLQNRATAPTSNPSDGGILYAESGALKWRGSSGTTTTIAVA